MIWLIGICNVFGVVVLWRHFKLLKKDYYNKCSELEHQKQKRVEAEVASRLWYERYENIRNFYQSGTGFEANKRPRA